MKLETDELVKESGEKSENTEKRSTIKILQPLINSNIDRKMIEETELTEDESGLTGWPVLKNEAMYGYAGRFVRAATENSEADGDGPKKLDSMISSGSAKFERI